MLASVGQDTLSDIPRFTFKNMNLSDGISFCFSSNGNFCNE